MGTKDRRRREVEETREKILHAARDLFLEHGYEKVTMRAIADAIEYTPTAIYHHFKNKNALLTELCRCDFGTLARHFNPATAPADPIERIVAAGEAYLRFALQYPSQYRFMFMTVIPPEEVGEDYIKERRDNPEEDAYAFLRDACRAAIEQGRLRPEIDDPDELAQILWAGIHGLVSLRMVKHDAWVPWGDLAATARRAIDIMVRGILRVPAGAGS